MLIVQILCGATMAFAAESRVFYLLTISLMCWTEGGHFTLMPTVFRALYGEIAGQMYAVMLSFSGLTCLLQMAIVASPLGGDYLGVFMLSSVLSLVSLCLLLGVFQENPI